jgi:Flp pilus assembly protein TadG
VALPVLVAVLLAGLWAVGAVTTRMRCQDAAHEAARALARGEPAGAVTAAALRLAPRGAEVSVRREPPLVRVTVRVVVRPLEGPLLLPGLPLSADAVAAEEAALPAPPPLPTAAAPGATSGTPA